MGRPPLGFKATQVRLPDDLRARISALVGDKGMAQFIRAAIERELDRREKPSPKRSSRKAAVKVRSP